MIKKGCFLVSIYLIFGQGSEDYEMDTDDEDTSVNSDAEGAWKRGKVGTVEGHFMKQSDPWDPKCKCQQSTCLLYTSPSP